MTGPARQGARTRDRHIRDQHIQDQRSGDPRTEELSANLRTVHERIEAACDAGGRDPAAITLVVVTKTFPAADVLRLRSLGVADIGENRDQEAAAKRAEVQRAGVCRAGSHPAVDPPAIDQPLLGAPPVGRGQEAESQDGPALRWHAIGHIQRNKAKSVVRWADVVHTVDSIRLADALTKAVAAAARADPLRCLIQVSLDGDPARGGIPAGQMLQLADHLADCPGLQLGGVMAVAPRGADPDRAFAALARQSARLQESHRAATDISAGMSGDLDAAVRHGSTCLRVGGAILGNRPLNP
ncbi:MAG: YggS family pyridoxal phosphate enzyme [Micrococcales bacterium]|nr:MAG: YggS family pyridoxal phosphate enzyme [Micrococcales bacterium]PIE27317.1 MAG: YggS family pyridoxal phosphate enzyme [Micrococcales bacterium]